MKLPVTLLLASLLCFFCLFATVYILTDRILEPIQHGIVDDELRVPG